MRKSLLLFIMTAALSLTGFRNPPGALRYVEMGDKYVSEGENELALEYYSKAVATEPENSSLYTTRGFFLLKLKRYDDALRDFTVGIRLEPGDPAGYLARGLVYSDLKRIKDADTDFAEACRLGSKDGCSFAGQK